MTELEKAIQELKILRQGCTIEDFGDAIIRAFEVIASKEPNEKPTEEPPSEKINFRSLF